MGTRADFYVGRGQDAEWLGSIAWDGYPDGVEIISTPHTSEDEWRAAVAGFIAGRDDGTVAGDGWPWPWNDSGTTDYAYAWDNGSVWASCYGGGWFDPAGAEPESGDGPGGAAVFPDMASLRSVVLGGPRSGLIVFRMGGGAG